MKVAVTGAAGFVGTHLCRALLERGIEVIPADKVWGEDLADPVEATLLVRRRPDVIIHLAARCSTPGSIRDPMGTFRDTVQTAVNILDAAVQKEIPVLLTSSVKARDGKTPYGAAKRMAELWALEMQDCYGVPIVINRPGTIYGPGQQGSSESGWVSWFLEAKRQNQQVTINGDGLQVRDLLHVSDYVNLLIMQMMTPSMYTNKIYDVGGGPDNVVTVLEMAKHLDLDYVHGPERHGDARAYIGFNTVPGWEPRVHWKESETFR